MFTRLRNKKKSIGWAILLLIFLYFSWGAFIPLDSSSEEYREVLIEEGKGLGQIAKQLREEGVIRSTLFFKTYTIFFAKATRLQAGNYKLGPSMNLFEVVRKISTGDIIKKNIIIFEGWNRRDILKSLRELNLISSDDNFLSNLRFSLWKDKYEFLAAIDMPDNWQIEGFLFPDTYHLKIEVSSIGLIDAALKNFGKKVNQDLLDAIEMRGKSLMEVVTMASILEKEVKTFEEKKIASGILWKRIKIGMPLQADATLAYITGKPSLKLTKSDLAIDSPFNTYKYKGLPPSPICNPGLESIKAAIYPQKSDFWYYLATPEGETLFSKTLKEHNIKRAEHLR